MSKFALTKKTATRLMALYREMDLVPTKKFHQDDCEACVIGHAMHNGIANGFTDIQDEFNDAIEWVGLPLVPEDTPSNYSFCYSIYDSNSIYEFGLLGNYLFGNETSVAGAARVLDLPAKCKTPTDAKKRIAAVLNMGGYDLVWED